MKLVKYYFYLYDDKLKVSNQYFYFDYQNSKYGYNTSSNRSESTFHPFRSDSTETYTFASGSTGSTVDLGATNNYRYINAENVYNKGKADSSITFKQAITYLSSLPTVTGNISGSVSASNIEFNIYYKITSSPKAFIIPKSPVGTRQDGNWCYTATFTITLQASDLSLAKTITGCKVPTADQTRNYVPYTAAPYNYYWTCTSTGASAYAVYQGNLQPGVASTPLDVFPCAEFSL